FLSSSGCGLNQPETATAIGFPDFHLTMVVTLDDGGSEPEACDSPSNIPWLSATPASGSVAAGMSSSVTVTVDASTLSAGEYAANLCVATNDPNALMITVPVTLTVEAGADDAIFCSGFEVGEDGSCGKEPPAPFEQPLQDPGFEATTDSGGSNPYWAGADSNDPGGTPFYNGPDFEIDAHGGEWFAWFGGWRAAASTQSFSQQVEIQAGGPRFINYWRNIVAEPIGTATLTVSVDGTPVETTNIVAEGLDPGWINRSVDIGSYGDGDVHTIKFEYTQAGSDDGNIFIDDVTIDAQAGSARR
ncbi:MAG: hypothetical protein J0H15_00040, partial [Xanthomonadales bacterium]|nr:hypothetical protein [Xanthomonadales bacterium]